MCPNQAFLPVTEQVILDHLQGRHTVGVYPLLADETCWFLGVDFDKAHWRDDVTAFSETCRATDLPCAIERSRSGNGAHVWFFFTQPVLAAVARRMSCFLITETISRRDQLDMASYDRLFPNQYAGRLHRTHPSKREVRVVDYVDDHVPMLARMFEKRLRGYRAMGYRKNETPENVDQELDFERGR